MTKVALNLCFEAHRNQRDKNGMPYVFHPFHMAEQMKDEKTTIVALLHDVVEDTDITLDDIRNMGFDNEVVAAIGLMTHAPDVPYMEYVAEIKKNPISKAVKLYCGIPKCTLEGAVIFMFSAKLGEHPTIKVII